MKNKLYSFLFGLIVSPIFVIVIYNLISAFDSIYLTSLSLVIIYGSLTYINYVLFKQTFLFAAICTILPVILIDASVLVTYPALVPIRFPIASVFPVLGVFIAFAIINKRNITASLFLSLLLVGVYGYFLYPTLLYWKMQKTEQSVRYNNQILKVPLIATNGDTIRLSDTLHAKLNLIELFFVGCAPCEHKSLVLNKLSEKYNRSDFDVINICSGEHNTYDAFQKYALKNKNTGFIYLYAPDSTLSKIYGSSIGFPFEQLLTNKMEFVSKEEGYNPAFEVQYLNKKINQIEKYAKSY